MRFHFGLIEIFCFGVSSIFYNCLHNISRKNTHCGHFDRNGISFRVIKCHISTTGN